MTGSLWWLTLDTYCFMTLLVLVRLAFAIFLSLFSSLCQSSSGSNKLAYSPATETTASSRIVLNCYGSDSETKCNHLTLQWVVPLYSAVSTKWILRKLTGRRRGRLKVCLWLTTSLVNTRAGSCTPSRLPLLADCLIAHHWSKTVPGNVSPKEKCISRILCLGA